MRNNLFQQVIESIKTFIPIDTQPVAPKLGGVQVSISPAAIPIDNRTQNQLTDLRTSVSQLKTVVDNLPSRIIKGMDVYAAGESIVGVTVGKVFNHLGIIEFKADSTATVMNGTTKFKQGITVPDVNDAFTTFLDINTSSARTMYIVVDERNLVVKEFVAEKDVILAKIVINVVDDPIVDDRNGINNYIVSGKDLAFSADLVLDDETKSKFRSIMDELLAENLIGTIKLSEGLDITNQDESIKLNANSMGIYDSDTKFASFDKDGVYFYQTNGQTLAQYTKSGATIGQIRIKPATIESMNFKEGNRGFQINQNGHAEFSDVTVRGHIDARSGTIGKWTIGIDRLTNTGDSTGLAPQDYPFYAGATFATRSIAPFRVTASGAMFATNATISGVITANYIQANSGLIGGWTIQPGLLSGGVMRLYASGQIFSINTNINALGVLSATSARISGILTADTLTCNSGVIGGWTIGATTLSGGNTRLNSNGDISGTDFTITSWVDTTNKTAMNTNMFISGTYTDYVNAHKITIISGGPITLNPTVGIRGQSIISKLHIPDDDRYQIGSHIILSGSAYVNYANIVEVNNDYGSDGTSVGYQAQLRPTSGTSIGVNVLIFDGSSGTNSSHTGINTQVSTDYANTNYGAKVWANGSTNTTTGYGIYAKATGAVTNWAGYFDDGNVYIENTLTVNNQHRAYVTISALQGNVGGGTPYAILWDQETYDVGGLHSLTTNISRITITEAGTYYVLGQAAMAGGTPTSVTIMVYVNGTKTAITTEITNTGVPIQVSDVVVADVDDYIEIFVDSTGSNINVSAADTQFKVIKWH